MSGTSLDGVDLVISKFILNKNKWRFSILSAETINYSPYWIEILNNAINFEKDKLLKLDVKYSEFLAQIINKFCEDNPKFEWRKGKDAPEGFGK